jgi:hypothetical protein
MYKNIKLIKSDEDKNLKVSAIKTFKYAAETTQTIISYEEFFEAAKSQPIVFGKDGSGSYYAAALLGLKEGKNLFVSGKGEWKSDAYIPAYLRRYPFIFVEDGETLALAVDKDCKEVNEKKGQALFDEKGEMSEYAATVLKFMKAFQTASVKTSAIIKIMDEMGLLEEANASMKLSDESFMVKGFYRVNEQKLDALSDEDTLKLVRSGFYKFITAHLLSLSNFNKLVSYSK